MDERFSFSFTDAMVAVSLKMYSGDGCFIQQSSVCSLFDSLYIFAIKRLNSLHILRYRTLLLLGIPLISKLDPPESGGWNVESISNIITALRDIFQKKTH